MDSLQLFPTAEWHTFISGIWLVFTEYTVGTNPPFWKLFTQVSSLDLSY